MNCTTDLHLLLFTTIVSSKTLLKTLKVRKVLCFESLTPFPYRMKETYPRRGFS